MEKAVMEVVREWICGVRVVFLLGKTRRSGTGERGRGGRSALRGVLERLRREMEREASEKDRRACEKIIQTAELEMAQIIRYCRCFFTAVRCLAHMAQYDKTSRGNILRLWTGAIDVVIVNAHTEIIIIDQPCLFAQKVRQPCVGFKFLCRWS